MTLTKKNSSSFFENIYDGNNLVACILKSNYISSGIDFLTEPTVDMQLGYMRHKSGHIIKPHVHNKYKREIYTTSEALFLKSGSVRVQIYTDKMQHLKELIMGKGDFLLLLGGGHSFELLEDSELIEIKQGPYAGDKDKMRY